MGPSPLGTWSTWKYNVTKITLVFVSKTVLQIMLLQENAAPVQKDGFLPTRSVVAPNLTAMLHQKYFPQRTKIPVALTFKKYDEDNVKESHTVMPVNIAQVSRTSEMNNENSSPQMQTANNSLQVRDTGSVCIR